MKKKKKKKNNNKQTNISERGWEGDQLIEAVSPERISVSLRFRWRWRWASVEIRLTPCIAPAAGGCFPNL